MLCPKCYGKTKTWDTRPLEKPEDAVMRRHTCLECGHRFQTIEILRDWFDELTNDDFVSDRKKAMRNAD